MKRQMQKRLAVMIGILSLLTQMGCAEKMNRRTHTGSGGGAADGTPVEEGDTADTGDTDTTKAPDDIKYMVTNIGVRNFEQVNEAMSVVTGIPPTTAAVQTAFAELKTQMPDNNDIRAFLAAHQAAFTKLAVEYCDAMLNDATKQQELFGTVSLTTAPRTFFTPENKIMVSKAFVKRFWGEGRSDTMTAAELEPLTGTLIDEILAGKNTGDTTLTLRVLKGVCTAYLAASPVTLL